MSATPEVSVVVPVYRNASTLAELAARLCATLDDRHDAFELVFVDDACPEGSSRVLTSLSNSDDRVRVATHTRNRGQNEAVLTGLEAARGRFVVVIDADLQDPPEAIPELLDGLIDETDAVFGGRRGAYESRARLATSLLHKRLLHVASGRRVPIDAGLFVAMTRRMVDRVVALRESDPYVIALMARTGLTMSSIPVERAARTSGVSGYTFAQRARLAWRAVAIAISRGGSK